MNRPMEDSVGSEEREPIEKLAESFLESHRRGEAPTVESFAELYPDLADRIRELFPAILKLEDLGPGGRVTEPALGPPEAGQLERLGEYRILREIGRGGMGVVYEAEQETLGRRVALKVLPRQRFGDGTGLQRFQLEARSAARLHHTNIVPVFAVGNEGDVHYYVMQFIRGQSLAQVLREVKRLRERPPQPSSEDSNEAEAATPDRVGDAGARFLIGDESRDSTTVADGRLPTERDSRLSYFRSVARIGLGVAGALAYAHGEGVLHRDIKPSNLLLDGRGTVWITDFGLAKAGDSSDLTASGSLVGTLGYIAPERLEGEADARSDVYSLGVTLYELLTLAPPFSASDRAQLVKDITSKEPLPPRRREEHIPRDLENVVLKAMAKEPEARYRSAQELADDLRRFLDYEPVLARRASWTRRLWRFCQRNPSVATLSAAVFVLLATIAVGATIASLSLREQRDEASSNLLRSRFEEGRALRQSTESGRRQRSLEALREAAASGPSVDLRSEMIGALALTDLREVRSLPADRLVYDRFLERSAVVGDDGAILVYAAAEIEPFARLPGTDAQPRSFSPSGRWLAVASGDGRSLSIWDVEREEAIFELERHINRLYPVEFLPDESGFVVAFANGRLELRGLPTGELRASTNLVAPAYGMAFDRRGERLAVSERGGIVVHLLDGESLEKIDRLYHPTWIGGVAWDPSGTRVAVACRDFNVHLWDADAGERLRVLSGHSSEVTRVAFSHGGALLASTGWDSQTILWNPDTGERLAHAGGEFLAFARDDRHLGFRVRERRQGVWRIGGGEEFRTLYAPSLEAKGPTEIAASPDGRWLAAACRRSGVRFWSLANPTATAVIECGSVESVKFHPGGGWLLTSGSAGLLRWPIRERLGAAGSTVTIGAPESLGIGGHAFSIDRTGDVVAATFHHHQIRVFDLRSPDREIRFDHGPYIHRICLSASARWVASTTWGGHDVRVWNIAEGTLEAEFETTSAEATFSPDERWLVVTTSARHDIYDTKTWSLAHSLQRPDGAGVMSAVGFSPDSRTLAIAVAGDRVDLFAVDGWKELARLHAPNSTGVHAWLAEFVPRTGLLAVTLSDHRIQLWDLGAVRRQLSAFGLDWSAPRGSAGARNETSETIVSAFEIDYGPARRWYDSRTLSSFTRNTTLARLYTKLMDVSAHADLYRERAKAAERLGRIDLGIADLGLALEVAPDNVDLLGYRVELLTRLGRYDAALDDLDRAVEIRRERLERAEENEKSALLKLLRRRATLRLKRGDRAAALRDFEALLELSPGDGIAAREVAWAWVLEPPGDDAGTRALELAERAIALTSGDSVSVRVLAGVLLRLGRLDESATQLQKLGSSAKADPEALRVQILRAALRRRQGEDEATAGIETIDALLAHGRTLPEFVRAELEAVGRLAEASQ